MIVILIRGPRGGRFKTAKKLFNKFIVISFQVCSEEIIDFHFLNPHKNSQIKNFVRHFTLREEWELVK